MIFQPNEQTLQGSYSSVSTPNFANKYILTSTRLKALDEIYKMHTLFQFKKSAKFRQMYSTFSHFCSLSCLYNFCNSDLKFTDVNDFFGIKKQNFENKSNLNIAKMRKCLTKFGRIVECGAKPHQWLSSSWSFACSAVLTRTSIWKKREVNWTHETG